ncbi:MAG: Uma2 family endonuclease [Anaerolineae bacterium]
MVDQVRAGMPLEAFEKLPDNAEYIDGEVVLMSPTKIGHSYLANLLADFLKDYVRPRQLGQVLVEAAFAMVESPDWVTGSRTPDVSFFAADRWNAYVSERPNWQSAVFTLVPDLAVEIVSDNDDFAVVQRKAERYLEDGVRMVWVIEPSLKLIYVYEPNRPEILRVRESDLLRGGEVIAGFEVKAAQCFA